MVERFLNRFMYQIVLNIIVYIILSQPIKSNHMHKKRKEKISFELSGGVVVYFRHRY